MSLAARSALVLGLGESGLAMARWLHRQGLRIRVADSRTEVTRAAALQQVAPQATLQLGAFDPALLEGIELVAVSPGLAGGLPLLVQARAAGLPVVSEIELFAWAIAALPMKPRVVAITGSNGKTTTTALVAHLLQAAGCRAVAAGNIGPSALDALLDHAADAAAVEVWVLELSSFQLECTYGLMPDAATVLNVSEDHLDRHGSLAEYAAVKARVFHGRGAMVLNRDDDHSLANGRCGRRLITFGLSRPPRAVDFGMADDWLMRGGERLLPLAAMRLRGRHNAANALAALALADALGHAPATLLAALRDFAGLPHRVQPVAEIDGVIYVDDSKGTNVGASVAAVEGLGRPVCLIAGGEGKGQDFGPLAAAVQRHGRALALIGRDAAQIAAALFGWPGPIRHCQSLDEAVQWCAAQARRGDAVLLSPACASQDMFRDYRHRAEVFVAAVQRLGREI